MKSPASKKRIFLRRLGWALAVFIAWCGFIAGRIMYIGGQDRTERSDVIIVLGAAVRKGEPSPALAGRIQHAVELWKSGIAPKIIFTGGLGHDGQISEAEVSRRIALESGVDAAAILTENISTKTWENLTGAAAIMKERGLYSAIIVSDPFHLHRAQIMANHSGINAVTSPTPHTAFRTWRTKFPFLMNEVRLFHSHWMYRLAGKRE